MKGPNGDPGNATRRLCAALAAVVFVLAPAAGFAAAGRHIRFDRISIEHGLSSATVPCIFQDSAGFIWFGTQDGLNRYDGHSFVIFKHDAQDPATLADNWIRSLAEDAAGDLWIATAGGLSRWHRATDSFTNYRHDPQDPGSLSGDRIWSLLHDREGTLWVGTEAAGLNRYDPATQTFERLRHDAQDPASLSDDKIRALHEDRSGRLWIGTLEGGLNLLRPAAPQEGFARVRHRPDDPTSLSDDSVRSILEDRTGTLWVGTLGGLNRLTGRVGAGALAFERFRHDPADPSSLSEDRVRVLFEDSAGRLWVGTDGGLNLFHGGAFARYQFRADDPHSLSTDRVVAIYQDRGGVLWVGTEGGGVTKWHSRTWSFANDVVAGSELSSRYILSVAEDGAGNLWLGTNGAGVNRLERATGAVTQFRHDPAEPSSLAGNRVTALYRDRRDALWVGTLAGGLDRFDAATETFDHFPHDPAREDSLGARGVMALHEDAQGVLWVGTFGGGLNRFQGAASGAETGTFVRHRHDAADPLSLASDRVSALAGEGAGTLADETLWVGTYGGGLDRFQPGAGAGVFEHFRHDPERPSSLSNDTVLVLHPAPDGTLWVGTHNGLNKLQRPPWGIEGEAEFLSYVESDGLPSAVIYGIHSDARGRLWLSTNKGISRFDPVTETFKNFDVSHGLTSEEFNQGAHYQSPSGEIVFGGISGFNAFYPDSIEANTTIPPVVLTSFSKQNQPVRLERPIFDVDEISLDHRDRIVSFEFAALDYTAPARNRYRYRLEGFADDWVDLGHRRRVSFTNLDPGRYVLRVIGSNNDGAWNEEGTAVALVMAPAPWKTWWAYALYGLAVAMVAGAFIHVQRQKVAQQRAIAERERRVAERERAQSQERQRLIARLEDANVELEEKNAELERFTYTVSHDLKSPLVTIKGFVGLLRGDAAAGNLERMDEDIVHIETAADKMKVLLDEMLEYSRLGRMVKPPEEVPLDEVVDAALGNVAGSVSERGVEVAVASGLPVVLGDRTQLTEVFQNLLENAVRYMGEQAAPRVEVGLRTNGATGHELYVSDNGVGIDPQYHQKIFGLFERLDAETEGTGVGLALVKRIVELHGGEIWIESQGAGHGATFRFTLVEPVWSVEA